MRLSNGISPPYRKPRRRYSVQVPHPVTARCIVDTFRPHEGDKSQSNTPCGLGAVFVDCLNGVR